MQTVKVKGKHVTATGYFKCKGKYIPLSTWEKVRGAWRQVNMRLFDVSTPVNVVASAYDTSGNGGRKLVRLSNGWLVAIVLNTAPTNDQFILYVNKNNDGGWSQLCYIDGGVNWTIGGFAITAIGNSVHVLASWLVSSCNIQYWRVQADTVSNVNVYSGYTNIAVSLVAVGGVSITAHTDGTLHAAWASKNATYPNSFNIQYSKSTDGGVTWAAVTQLYQYNTSGVLAAQTPCIIVRPNGYPVIVWTYTSATAKQVCAYLWNGSSWGTYGSFVSIYDGGASYTQSNPCATVAPDGTIHVVWHGTDATDTTRDNVSYSKSTDGGVNWSAAIKLTSGGDDNNRRTSIATDYVGDIYVVYQATDTANAYYRYIHMLKCTGGTWNFTPTIYFDGGSTSTVDHPSLCDNYKNFTVPLGVWMHTSGTSVKFRGVWYEN